mmetsp:Transcript_40193/g.107722  ORF Transcript_40193/g.107722 Transcript_40193/m.107722 type:complete len:286 (-) Transcript_40193:195-1052(-)
MDVLEAVVQEHGARSEVFHVGCDHVSGRIAVHSAAVVALFVESNMVARVVGADEVVVVFVVENVVVLVGKVVLLIAEETKKRVEATVSGQHRLNMMAKVPFAQCVVHVACLPQILGQEDMMLGHAPRAVGLNDLFMLQPQPNRVLARHERRTCRGAEVLGVVVHEGHAAGGELIHVWSHSLHIVGVVPYVIPPEVIHEKEEDVRLRIPPCLSLLYLLRHARVLSAEGGQIRAYTRSTHAAHYARIRRLSPLAKRDRPHQSHHHYCRGPDRSRKASPTMVTLVVHR